MTDQSIAAVERLCTVCQKSAGHINDRKEESQKNLGGRNCSNVEFDLLLYGA